MTTILTASPTQDSRTVRFGGMAPALKPVADAGTVRLGGMAPALRRAA